MLHAHTVEQVRAAERELMARLPEGTLMQRAAAGLAAAVVDFLGSAYGRRVLLLVGSGDNGGDALYAGAMLARRGVAAIGGPPAGADSTAPPPRSPMSSTGMTTSISSGLRMRRTALAIGTRISLTTSTPRPRPRR